MKRIIALLLLAATAGGTAFAELLVSMGPGGVDRYSDDGVFLGTLIAPGSGGLADAQGVAVSPLGQLFVGDFQNDNILRFAPDGTFLNVFASGPAIATPFDVVFGTGGDLFVANAGGLDTIARIDPVTGAVKNASFTLDPIMFVLGGPQYLEFGPTLALTDIAGHLFRYDPVTGANISAGAFDNPEGVAYNAAGDLFMAQRGSGNIIRFPFGGGPSDLVIPDGTFSPALTDIEFGPNGLLYVSADKIYRYDVSGAKGKLIDSFGTGGEFLVFHTPIPEPGTWALATAGLAALAYLRRRRG